MVDITGILEKESLAVWFQPIVSVRRQSIQIMEALARGIDPHSGEIIPPLEMFEAARRNFRLGDLEQLCIRKALENFNHIKNIYPNTLLSLNMGNDLIDHIPGESWLYDMLREMDIPPNRVIIEVLESVLFNQNLYRSFLSYSRKKGILLAIDDVGSQHSGLLRIVEVKPDLIKIDRNLIFGINNERWQLEVVRALTSLAHRTGVLVIAEGVEKEEEALECMELGVDLQQGFLYSRAHSFDSLYSDRSCQQAMERMAQKYRVHSRTVQQERRQRIGRNTEEIRKIYNELSKVSYTDLDAALYWLVEHNRNLQFIYILNESGFTITDTVGRSENMMDHRMFIFRPARKGEDLSLKDYFLWIQSGLNRYVSEPYISSATGNKCVTHSMKFGTADGVPCILCVDINVDSHPEQHSELSDL